uniref:Mitochondria-eating protein n=2 Tax=Acrobeloides nanus TaxID=290746 RepID=A0A914DSC6_9BILA
MIQLVESETDPIDAVSLQHLTDQVRALDIDDLETFLKIIPPTSELIKSIPQSLQLLDAIYEKCDKLKADSDAPTILRYLEPRQVLNRILWWLALTQQSTTPRTSVRYGSSITNENEFFQFTVQKGHIKSILGVIQREAPEILEEIIGERMQMASCLESLGCHGLVNCSDGGMIRLFHAVFLESEKHYEKVKAVSTRIKELHKRKALMNEGANHQLSLNLKLSEVFDRLKQNELIEMILNDLLNSNHLASLLRIVRKRVRSDKLLISLFNQYNNSRPTGFAICEVDPIVAKLIVAFKHAYNQLYAMIPSSSSTSSDSGNVHDDSDLHFSVTLDEEDLQADSMQSHNGPQYYMDRSASILDRGNELISRKSSERVVPIIAIGDRFYEEDRWVTLPMYSSSEQVDSLVQRFANLYLRQKKEIMETLNRLPEFVKEENPGRIQLKTMLSVVVLTYHSVKEGVKAKYHQVYETLDIQPENTSETDLLFELSIYRMLHRRAKSERGMIRNAKEVADKIWETLFDFPSLKTCTRFNRFLLECVDIIWDLVAGIDGRLPRIRVEYEWRRFDDRLHVRHHMSNVYSQEIRQCLWPALINIQDDKCLLKAIVVT